jgi:hypothetical protein
MSNFDDNIFFVDSDGKVKNINILGKKEKKEKKITKNVNKKNNKKIKE